MKPPQNILQKEKPPLQNTKRALRLAQLKKKVVLRFCLAKQMGILTTHLHRQHAALLKNAGITGKRGGNSRKSKV
nr:MAG TPA: hypothetical protein [Caudoviricetes sp.]